MLHDEPFGGAVSLSPVLLLLNSRSLSPSPSTGNLATRAFGHHYHFDNTTDPREVTPILEEEEADSDLSSRGVSHALIPRAVATNTTTNSTIPTTNTTVPTVPSPRQRIEMLSWPPAPGGESMAVRCE